MSSRFFMVACLASFALGCGGKADSDVFQDDGGTGGSSADGTGGTASGGSSATGGSNGNGSGDTGGAGGSGTSAGTVGSTGATSTAGPATSGSGTSGGMSGSGGAASSGTSGSGTTGSGGAPPDRCLQPLVTGSCEAYFQRYGFNVDTGRCESFVYGGCDGNDNQFDTLEACLDMCDPGGRTECKTSPDCVIDHGCCGFCNIDSVEGLVAVNHRYASFRAPECSLVDCAQCEPPPEFGYYAARCNEGACEVYDIRTSDFSSCETDDDCWLRPGLECCPSCGETTWVAVSGDHASLERELCGDTPAAVCPACAPAEPEGLAPICGSDGHCAVANLPE